MTTILGILFGLTTAFSQTLAYIFSRLFVIRHKHAFWRLLLISHTYMGIVSLIALPFLWPDTPLSSRSLFLPLMGTALFYIAGQSGLLLAMKFTNPSRIAPLLGAKIIVMAILATLFFGKTTTPMQWLAVFACLAAVLSLNFSGGSLSIKSIAVLLLTCTLYSLSDLNIDLLVHVIGNPSSIRTALLGASLCYAFLGIISIPITLITEPEMIISEAKLALPFSALWLGAIISLFLCIGLVGPVFAVILQSSRGLMSIALGAILAAKGWTHVEQKLTKQVLLQRIAAAALMIAAVTLYTIGRP